MAWLVADETTVHKLIPFRLKSPAATIFGWWLEELKNTIKGIQEMFQDFLGRIRWPIVRC